MTSQRRRSSIWRLSTAGAALALLLATLVACGSSGSEGNTTAGSADTSTTSGNGSNSGSKTTGAEPITLGVVAALSGPNSYVGDAELNGLKLSIKQINKKGGVLNGRPLKLSVTDGACEAGKAVGAYKKLVSEGVPAIFASACSGATLAGMPIAKDAKIPLLVSDSSNHQISEKAGVGGNQYTWRINADDPLIATAFVKYIAKHASSVMVIAGNNDYGRGGAEVYKEALPKAGVEYAGALFYKPGTANFRPYIAKLQSSSADAVFLVGEPRDEGNIIRQIREQGLDYGIFGRGVTSPDILKAIGDPSLAKGVVSGDFWAVGMDPSYDKAYKQAYGTLPPIDSPGFYYGAKVMAKAINRGGGATAAVIQKGFEGLEMKVGWGPVKFDAHNQAHPNVVISTFDSNGNVKIISTESSEQ